MEQVKKFSFDVGWVFVSSVVTLLIGFLLRVILARWLGATDLGLYQMVITIYGIGILVATFGIPVALIKYVAEYKDDQDKLTQTVSSGLISSVIFGIVAGILMYALSGLLANFFHMPELAHLLRILAIVFPFTCIFETWLGLFTGLRKMKTYTVLMTLRSLLMTLLTIAFVKLGFGIEGAVFAIVLSVFVGCIVGLFPSRAFFRPNLRGFIENARRLVSFGGQAFGGNAVNIIANQADIVLIGYFLTAATVGYYSVAVNLSMFLPLVPSAIQRVTFPATSEYWSKNNREALQRMIDKSMKYSMCIMLFLGLVIGFFSEAIITAIFGEEFIYAVLPLCVLLISRVIRGGTIVPIGASLAGIGRPDLALKAAAISAATNVGLNILLIPRFGILGAAIATTISLLLQTIIYLVFVVKTMMVRIDVKWYAQAMGFAVAAVVLFLIGARLINSYLVGGVILCAYIALAFRILLTGEDRSIFRSLAYSLLNRR